MAIISVQDGAVAGTTVQSLAIEAIRITVVKQRASYAYNASGNLAVERDFVNGIAYRHFYDHTRSSLLLKNFRIT